MQNFGKKSRRTLESFALIPYWLFLALFILSAAVSVYALRANNQKMAELRNAVYAADERGKGVEEALDKLRQHVHSHMNTNLTSGNNAIKPPIQLKHTYERLVAQEQRKAGISREKIYEDAQRYCERQNPTSFSGRSRLPCIEDYVTRHSAAQAPTVPAALYQYDFVSPAWSPDLAGWSLVLTTVVFVLFVLSFAADRLVKAKLKEL